MCRSIQIVSMLCIGLIGLETFATQPENLQPSRKRVTLNQMYEKRLGGRLIRPGSGKGATGFVNVCNAVSDDEVNRVITTIGKSLAHHQKNIHIDSLAGLPNREMVKRLGLEAAVFVVATNSLPAMLVAPEERWSLVNVTQLKGGLTEDSVGKKLFLSRCRGELQRAFCFVAGCGTSQSGENLMSLSEVDQLDSVNPDLMVFDTVTRCQKYLTKIGVTFPVHVSYQKACQEGWAPAPTNDIQRAIWQQVHATPTDPLKITFDPKTDTK